MSWHKMRPLIDILMGIMLIFEMLYMLTGNFLHEVVGVAFFATLIAHIALSRNWLKGIAIKAQRRQKLSLKNKAKIGMIVALAGTLVLLLVSSALISNVLGAATGLMLIGAPYDILALAHTVCAYVVCIAVICHVGLHWVGLFKSLKIPYNPQRRRAINAGVTTLASVGVVAVAMTALKEMASWDELASQVESQTGRETDPQADGDRTPRTENGGEPYAEGGRGPRGGGRHGRGADTYGAPEDGSNPYNGGTPYGDSSPYNGGRSQDGGQSQGDGSAQDGSGSSSSICTLCRKRCPLSAPKCNKPYAVGLI